MTTVKATFTLDEATVSRLARMSERLKRPKSEVVREAILDYSERTERLSEPERIRILRSFDELVPRIPAREAPEVARELDSLREARRGGGRRTGTDR